MDYKGVIIEESLRDKAVLALATITETNVETVTEAHKTPWLKQWTLHTVTIPETRASQLAETLSHALADNYWYADYRNRATHYVIFPNRIFRVDCSKPDEYEAVKTYGTSLGIPDYQLTFSSEIAES